MKAKKVEKHKDKIIGLIVSLIFIGLIVWRLDWNMLADTIKMFNYKVLFAFVPLYVLSIYIRGARWKYLLCLNEKLSVKEAFLSFTAGNTLNSYLPARAGDFWRAYHVGNKISESKMKLFGSIILERIIDGISVLLILFFAVITYFNHPDVLKVGYISAFLFIGALVFFFIVVKTGKIDVIFQKLKTFPVLNRFESAMDKMSLHMQSFMSGFEVMNNPRCFAFAFLMSITAWTLECVVTYILILGFGQYFGFSISFFVISFIALSTIIPSSSVFVGPYQFAYILALGIYHVNKSQALGIAFIHQLTIMLVITVIAIIYFMSSNSSLKDIKAGLTKEDKNE